MKQRYTGLKKKKARLLNELYPGTNIEIVYRRDYDHLLRSLSTAGVMMSDNGLSYNTDNEDIEDY